MEHLFSEIIDQGIGWERMHLKARQGEMVYSAVQYFRFVGVYFFFGPHVSRPTVGTKSFDIALNSILSDGPTG